MANQNYCVTTLLKIIFYSRISLSCQMGNLEFLLVHRKSGISTVFLKSIDCLCFVQFDHATPHTHLLLARFLKLRRKCFVLYSKSLKASEKNEGAQSMNFLSGFTWTSELLRKISYEPYRHCTEASGLQNTLKLRDKTEKSLNSPAKWSSETITLPLSLCQCSAKSDVRL